MLKMFIDEVRTGRREGSVISTQTIDSLSTDEREAWRQLRKELESVGITPALFTQHHSFIVTTLQKAIIDKDLARVLNLDDSDMTADPTQKTSLPSKPISPSAVEPSAKLTDTSVRRPSPQDHSSEKTSSNGMPNKSNSRVLKKPSRLVAILSRLLPTDKELLKAASIGNAVLAKQLLEGGGVYTIDLGRALYKAAQKGHVEVVKLLLARPGVEVNFLESDRRTPLSWAAGEGHETLVKLLLAHPDVDVNLKDLHKQTSLSWAAAEGHEAIVKLLLAHLDIDANLQDAKKRTPLLWAARYGHEAVVKLLLAHPDIDANRKDYFGITPLWEAVSIKNDAVANLFLAHFNVQFDSKDNFERTFLSWASENGDEEVVGGILRGVPISEYLRGNALTSHRRSDTYKVYYWIIRYVLARFK